ncbi:MAG: Cache 3/Cache 2 fusion domain-containing protein [Deltaproteobacteria bacterium]|nr:Cache 3/Cache 2 fusion domain-containing protein [Deltaproteobacteria bacterium]
MNKRKEAKKFRIRITLPLAVVLLIGVTVLVIALMNYANTVRSLRQMAYRQMSQITEHTLEKTLNHLQKAEKIVALNRSICSPEIFEIDFSQQIEERHKIRRLNSLLHLFYEETRIYGHLAMVYMGDERGSFWMLRRMPDGAVATKNIIRTGVSPECEDRIKRAREQMAGGGNREEAAKLISGCIQTSWLYRDRQGQITGRETDPSETYDPRIRPWYIAAKSTGDLSWTDVYVFYSGKKPGITASVPVFSGDRFLGALGVDIELEQISQFLKGLRIGKTGRAFILNGRGNIVAFPDPSELNTTDRASGQVRINNIRTVKDRAAATSFEQLEPSAAKGGDAPVTLKEKRLFSFDNEGQRFVAMYTPFPLESKLNWLVGVIVPEDDFLGEAKRTNIFVLLISLASMCLAIGLGMMMSQRITAPLTKLSDETARIKEFELDGEMDIRSRFLEIERMADSFEGMKSGLRSFRKFVPADLVRYLIRSGREAELGAENRELTILFSDIAGFTTISETLRPRELVEQLGEYLEEMSGIIDGHGGTVDKYIGDAIMAFWNAPQDVPDHILKGCFATLDCLKRLSGMQERWRSRGLPPFHARFGLHTGSALVGNMGSRSRLNYTAIGDSVNLASRLEGVGKYYGVSCIVSEAVFNPVRDRVVARRLDRIAVKGKREGVFIYELIAYRGEVDAARERFIGRYEEALEAYLARRWVEAETLFDEADRMAGPEGDPCSHLIRERCAVYREAPPPDSWDGIHRLDSK